MVAPLDPGDLPHQEAPCLGQVCMDYVVSIAGILTTAKPRYQRRWKPAQAVPLDQRVIKSQQSQEACATVEGRWEMGP